MEDNYHCTGTKEGYVLRLPVCQEEVSPEQEENTPSLVQVKPEPPQIKEEPEEGLLQRPEDGDDGSSLTSHGVIYGSGYVLHVENAEFLHLPVCKEEACPGNVRNSGLVQEEPELPQMKEEQEELLQRPDEAGGSTLTLLAVKHEASGSTQHMKTEDGVVEDRGASQPASDDFSSKSSECDTEYSDENWEETAEGLSVVSARKSHRKQAEDSGTTQQPARDDQPRSSSHSSESDTEDSDEDWEEETGEGPSVLNAQKPNKDKPAEGQMSISEKLFKDLTSSRRIPSMRSYTGTKTWFNCSFCRKCFGNMSTLKQHMRTHHAGEKSFKCTDCDRSFRSKAAVRWHMHSHTKENPYSYSYKYLSID